MPVEKYDACETRINITPIELSNIAYLGTSVESGSAAAVVVATGAQTYFGAMAKSITGQNVETSLIKALINLHGS